MSKLPFTKKIQKIISFMPWVLHIGPKCAPPAHAVPISTIRRCHRIFSVNTNIHDFKR